MRRYANHCVHDYCLCCGLHGQAVHIARSSYDPFRLQEETVLKVPNAPYSSYSVLALRLLWGSSVA
jgi:hypothetical protein